MASQYIQDGTSRSVTSSAGVCGCVCVWVSLSRDRNTGARGEDSLDALVVIVVCQQSPLLQVSLPGAPDQVTLAPL